MIGEQIVNNKYEGFLYGHYDSRGGTTFVNHPDRATADLWYASAFGFDEDDMKEFAPGLALEDYLGPATIYSDVDLLANGAAMDLSEQFTGDTDHVLWMKVPDDVKQQPDDEDSDDYNWSNWEPYELYYLTVGTKPPCYAVYGMRFDDDAFGLVIQTEELK
jgi:hypothetical protein